MKNASAWSSSKRATRCDGKSPCPLSTSRFGWICGYRLDIVVENQVILEIKAVERLMPIHEAQLLTYMKLSGIRTGLLLNFHVAVLKDGIRRLTLKD